MRAPRDPSRELTMSASRPSFRRLRFAQPTWVALFCAACLSLVLASCTRGGVRPVDIAWKDAQQMVLVTSADWDANQGTMRTFVRDGDDWRAASGAVPVMIGRAGSAWGNGLHAPQPGSSKREGDGRAPAGVFRIGTAFGYAADADTALPYAAMRESSWCIDVPASPLYNHIVDAAIVGAAAVEGSTEPMRRDLHADGDQRYKLGFVVEHNAQARSGAGSCIFGHLWKAPGEETAGCTAMDEPVMRELLAWLDQRQQPVFVLLPEKEYLRLKAEWRLPEVVL
jgi:L,D-peptidoglycan transpeptidase YkuD (ErfK/YbiS/YcfS/YnhG family)